MRATREGEVLIVSVTGAITVEKSTEPPSFIRMLLDAQDARAVVLDLRGAVFLVTEEGWPRLADKLVRKGLSPIPIAVLVSPAVLEIMRGHCRRMAARGYLRLTFVERPRALAWASRRLEHWERVPAHLAT